MQGLEVSGAVRPIYGSLGVKRLKAERIALLHTLPGIVPIYVSSWLSLYNLQSRRPQINQRAVS